MRSSRNISEKAYSETMTTTKRQREASHATVEEEVDTEVDKSYKRVLTVKASELTHPYGVKPTGNELFDSVPSCRSAGLGALACLNDDQVLELLGFLDATELCLFARVSKAAYAFGHSDYLWKYLVLGKFEGAFTFDRTWKGTYVRTATGKEFVHDPIKVPGLYSDALFQPWFCSVNDVLPHWISTDNIERRSNLSLAEFIEEYEKPNKPVLITDVIKTWPAYKKWDKDYLLEKYGDVAFRAGAVDIKMKDYFRYSEQVQEEYPLYIFDCKFCNKCDELASDFEVPEYFREDLFQVLGDSRPDNRWLIIGPERSGSVFHIDPNATSAWNAVVRGCKKWIMFPPQVIPPGVIPSADFANVTVPLSIAEWFINFYDEIADSPVKPIEAICREGEMVFVPSGWWHIVLNLEESTAVTQNYVSTANLPEVLRFLRDKPDQVSGYLGPKEQLYTDFMEALEVQRPHLKPILDAEKERVERLSKPKVSLWSMMNAPVTQSNDTQNTSSDASEASTNNSKKGEAAAAAAPTSSGFSFNFF